MKGLIIKDLFVVKKQGKSVLAITGFYLVFAIITKNLSMFGAVSVCLSILLPITSMSYDEYNKWDRYALSMPLSRKTIVLSKYALGIMLNLVVSVVICAVNIILAFYLGGINYGEVITTTLGICGAGILFLSILLPVIYKFGVEKARLLMMIVFLVPTLLIMLLSESGIKPPSEQMLDKLVYVAPAAVILILVLSINLSVKVYRSKEF